jgi:hypothetical protein
MGARPLPRVRAERVESYRFDRVARIDAVLHMIRIGNLVENSLDRQRDGILPAILWKSSRDTQERFLYLKLKKDDQYGVPPR